MDFLRRILGKQPKQAGEQSRQTDQRPTGATNQEDKKWVPGEGTTVFAFKALTPEVGALAMFGKVVTISSTDLDAKIRREARCPDAEVKLLEPGEWNAPEIPGLAQDHVVGAYPVVVTRASETLRRRFGIEGLSPQTLSSMGAGAMPHPTGHILFLFKVPGRLVAHQSTS